MSRKRFIREARVAAGLQHPNTVAVFDVGEDAGRPFIVMELLEGGSLANRIRAVGRLPVDEVDFGIATAVADAATHLTTGDDVLGTPRYLAPERVAGRRATSSELRKLLDADPPGQRRQQARKLTDELDKWMSEGEIDAERGARAQDVLSPLQ